MSGLARAGLGHNRGPSMEPGFAWRKHCWKAARRELLPHLPLEVVRLRVRRAAELGLDYRTYASVRESTGRDIIAFLFSSNALRLRRPGETLPPERAERLAALACGRTLLAHPPLDPARLVEEIAAVHRIHLDGAAPSPSYWAPWADVRAGVLAALAPARLPASGVLLVGETEAERGWCAAGRLAGYLAADRYFATAPTPAG